MDLTTAVVIVMCALTAPLWAPFVIGGVILTLGIPVFLIVVIFEVLVHMLLGRKKEARHE